MFQRRAVIGGGVYVGRVETPAVANRAAGDGAAAAGQGSVSDSIGSIGNYSHFAVRIVGRGAGRGVFFSATSCDVGDGG